jgi:hypothetical protein
VYLYLSIILSSDSFPEEISSSRIFKIGQVAKIPEKKIQYKITTLFFLSPKKLIISRKANQSGNKGKGKQPQYVGSTRSKMHRKNLIKTDIHNQDTAED